jgi:hypothetical protein
MDDRGRRRSHIGDARAFTPRGRTVRDVDPVPGLRKGPDDRWWNKSGEGADDPFDEDLYDDGDAEPRWGAASRRTGRSTGRRWRPEFRRLRGRVLGARREDNGPRDERADRADAARPGHRARRGRPHSRAPGRQQGEEAQANGRAAAHG